MNLIEGLKEYSVEVNENKISCLCKHNPASGELIFFIHGLACSKESFRNLFDKDYFPGKSLLVPDLLGFGRSTKPVKFSYRMEEQARLIEELLLLLPECKYHIVAHSMGAAVALLFNDDFYSRVLSFANIEGNLISEDCGLLSRSIAAVSIEDYKNKLYGKHSRLFKGHSQLRFEESNPEIIYKSAKSLVEWSDSGILLDKFKNLNCKKSYFYGEENNNMPVLKELNFISKYVISKSGHGMMTENPNEFYTKLADFIYSNE